MRHIGRYLNFFRRTVERDVHDELAFHFEQRVAEFMAAGATREQAEARARARFGDVSHTQAELRTIDQRVHRRRERADVLEQFRQDLVVAIRGLRRSPGLAIACIVTIALGVGANGAMFSLADRLFMRPPSGVKDPGALRRLYARTTWHVGESGGIRVGFPYPMFALLDSSLAPRVQLAAYTAPDTMPMTLDAAPNTTPRLVHGAYVTGSYMSVLGVQPALGRFFARDEEIMGTPVHVAIISDRFWRRTFNGDPNVIGRVVGINRQRTTIIGVAARGFDGPDLSATDAWMPFASLPESSDPTWYSSYFSGALLRLVGRLAPGTTDEWVTTVATTIVRRTFVPEQRGRANVLRDSAAVMLSGPILETLAPSMTPAPEAAIATRLVGVTIIVLLIACANVASLLLARAFGRRREIAVRVALGVSRSRLIAQLLSEGLVLAATAGVAALIVSVWAGNTLRAVLMPDTYWSDSAVDSRVLIFTSLVALGTGVIAGLVPALQVSRPELTEALKSGARDGRTGAQGSRLRQLLLVAQVAMSVLLLYGAGLFVRSLTRLRTIELGFDADRVVFASVYPINPIGGYVDWDVNSSPHVLQRLAETAQRVAAAPGVERVALATGGPMSWYSTVGAYLRDGSPVPRLDNRAPTWNATTSNYLEATGIGLVRGRFFTDDDQRGAPVIVVNEFAARSYWPEQDALGQCLRLLSRTATCRTVIGIVRDSHVSNVVERPKPQLMSPLRYDSTGVRRGANTLIVRAKTGQTAAVTNMLRADLARTFSSSAAEYVQAVTDRAATQLRPWRVGLLLFGGFGVLALIVSALGTYSVLSYTVTQRQHEIGVRMALGARAADVLRLIVSQGVRLTAIGVAVGLALALVAARVMQSLLYDTSPREPVVTVGVAALLVVIAAAASAVPARRAARVDPVNVLRAE